MADETNPFMEGLSRIAMVPINAAKLPFQILGEIANTPMARAERRAGEVRGQLAQQVTGQPSQFSPAKNTLSKLSLGLYQPPRDQVDPSQLNPAQQQAFQQLTPLQQRLLQAKRSSDFADLIQDGSLFEERPAPAPQTDIGKLNADVQAGFASPADAMIDQQTRYNEAFPQPKTIFTEPAQVAGLLDTFTPESVADAAESNDVSRLRPRPEVRDTIFTDPAQLGKLLNTFTPESVAEAASTRNVGALVPIPEAQKNVFADPKTLSGMFRYFTPGSIQQASAAGDFSLLERVPEADEDMFKDPAFVKTLVENFTPESVQEALSTRNLGGLAAKPEKLMSLASGAIAIDPVTGETRAENPKPADPVDENAAREAAAELAGKAFSNEQTLSNYVRNALNFDTRRTQAFAAAQKLFRLEDASRVDPQTLAEIRKTIPNIMERPKNAVRDIALMFAFMGVLEPEGIFREGEQQMVTRAKEIFGPWLSGEVIENFFQGEKVTDQQRADLFNAMQDIFSASFENSEGVILNARKNALRNRLAGGVMNPRQVLDPIEPYRSALDARAARARGDVPDIASVQFGLPRADQEARELISELYMRENPNPPQSPQARRDALIRYAAKLGFRSE